MPKITKPQARRVVRKAAGMTEREFYAFLDFARRAAVHEAGHAVAAHKLGADVKWIRMDAKAGPTTCYSGSELELFHQAVIGFAGAMAELACGYNAKPTAPQYRGDRRGIGMAIAAMAASKPAQKALLRAAHHEAVALVRVHWSAVRAVAQALDFPRCRLSGKQIRELIDQADRDMKARKSK